MAASCGTLSATSWIRITGTAVTKAETTATSTSLHLLPDPVAQYLHAVGPHAVQGAGTFDDLHRLQLDIETYTTPPHRFSNSARPGDRIILVALSDNSGWEHVIDGRKLTEDKCSQELVRIITERDPDVIEGHNILNFDLPYILTRCALHGVTLAIGRDGSVPRTFDTRTSFAEQPFEYTVTEIAGRHIIDTLLLVQQYDATRRNMESYGLKYAAQYFGFAPADRTYIPGEDLLVLGPRRRRSPRVRPGRREGDRRSADISREAHST